MSALKVALCVPTYNTVHMNHMNDLLKLMLGGKGLISVFAFAQSTLVAEGRNGVVRQIYKAEPGFTHLLFIDSDQCAFNAQHLIQLIEDNKPIISGITVMRRKDANGNRPCTYKPLNPDDKNEVVEVDFTGMFFTLIQRNVLDKVGRKTPEGVAWFATDRELPDEEEDRLLASMPTGLSYKQVFQVYKEAMRSQGHTGEDAYFCRRAREEGFRSFVDRRVKIAHICEDIYVPD